ncbi:MAG: phosphoribosylformylglycinamidine synthase [Solobacterium sp.]|jgi:phosphoribosylformylglycinamidine synthase|nr:phosphoribosylformylglycinamidine synthase [Solobacterium sp.]
MVYRIYVEKKPGFDVEAEALKKELQELLGIKGINTLRLINRYDVEDISEDLFHQAVSTVFSEPPVDEIYQQLPAADHVFAVEYLPGQFDQRADSASECIQLLSQKERPDVRSAKVYLINGTLSEPEYEAVKKYVINPVEAREASLETVSTLKMKFAVPTEVETLTGFTALSEEALEEFRNEKGLAMDHADIVFCQDYFKSEHRDPTITEIRLIDTYWSDHCRHTTFGTILKDVTIDDAVVQQAFERYQALRKETGRDAKPQTLMDLATIGAKALKQRGILKHLDESEEINACTVKIKCDVDGKPEDWLFLFKNETHNHPTEIEPFGGAATCIGGAIRDPLSGRSYVYQAMRVTGAADPLKPVSETMPGKLPQRKLVTTAAAGYSSYGNQIGLATGQVNELYHPGYAAKRMEIGAVVGATPASHVRREEPQPGDVIILLGGRTGRDGIGGATGSSKAHKLTSLESCGAEVQKGNAPIERKLQRLFRREDACRMIKRCNDFGAGGVSVAIGELADGLNIDLNKVTRKYEGLDGTELAISESQERMAVAVAKEDAEQFIALSEEENLEATIVAEVTGPKRMIERWNGKEIVNLSREFLSSNGASRHADAHVTSGTIYQPQWAGNSLKEQMMSLVSNLNVASEKGLGERFDSTIGAATVLMPYGGKYQLTPSMAMAAKLPVDGETTTCSGMAWGFNPYLTAADPYRGAYTAVAESVTKLVCAGFKHEDMYLTFQEYFEHLGEQPERWGKPLSALLGALDAQMGLGIGAIGGKDSMSGSFEGLDVPPTLVSFATAVGTTKDVLSPEFKQADSTIVILKPEYDHGMPTAGSLLRNYDIVEHLNREGKIRAAATSGFGGLAGELFKMCVGNRIGLKLEADVTAADLLEESYGTIILELQDAEAGRLIGHTTDEFVLHACGEDLSLAELQEAWEAKLEPVFPYRKKGPEVDPISYESHEVLHSSVHVETPRVIIPVFPGTNCEYDSAKAFRRAGADPHILVLRNLTPEDVSRSCEALVREIDAANMIMLPGGFSGGDEPDGSAKFISAFFRSPEVKDAVDRLMNERDGLMLGICNGFQALIKLGLVPYGEIRTISKDDPTLTYNIIGRHQSMLVHTRIASNKSPWLSGCQVNDHHMMPISHGEGRFVCEEALLAKLIENGQVATQYIDLAGKPTMDQSYNPNGSIMAIEGITSLDGRILGKMGHTERSGDMLYKNVPVDHIQPLFDNGVNFFRK